MNFYGAPTVDKGSLQGQPGYPSSGYPPSQPGLVQGSSLTQPRYPGPAGAMGQQYAGAPMGTTAQAMQGYSSISGYPSGMAYPSSMAGAGVQFRSAQPVHHPSLQTLPSTTLAYASQYPSMTPSYLSSHQLHQGTSYPPGNPVMTMPGALAHQGGFPGVTVTSVPRGFPVGAHSTIPAGHPSSLPAGMSPLGYPSGYPGQGPAYPSSNAYGGGQYPGI
ncbi:calcium-binding protein P-like [Crassostrea angulata]|nr:calcium-binding protein P [Crassostrea gigas]XP_011417632.2 calcium-binding protein P [Crassostrea gigas]XP_034336925.1 calcium-binding protein P [Crassostrea gigas]XP_052712399.1 calcium-binding protein P-like [Crassostrea angulata]XP_052712400.1 calcium-binding protein P-like [Crassostrea angulata]